MEVQFNEREWKVLQQLSCEKEMSEGMLLRHALRVYQIVDKQWREGGVMLFRRPDGTIFDPLDCGPKMAPMPEDLPQGF